MPPKKPTTKTKVSTCMGKKILHTFQMRFSRGPNFEAFQLASWDGKSRLVQFFPAKGSLASCHPALQRLGSGSGGQPSHWPRTSERKSRPGRRHQRLHSHQVSGAAARFANRYTNDPEDQGPALSMKLTGIPSLITCIHTCCLLEGLSPWSGVTELGWVQRGGCVIWVSVYVELATRAKCHAVERMCTPVDN